jgi:hypothetical protein
MIDGMNMKKARQYRAFFMLVQEFQRTGSNL